MRSIPSAFKPSPVLHFSPSFTVLDNTSVVPFVMDAGSRGTVRGIKHQAQGRLAPLHAGGWSRPARELAAKSTNAISGRNNVLGLRIPRIRLRLAWPCDDTIIHLQTRCSSRLSCQEEGF